MPRPAGTRIDHYELLEHLADGAQAEVHRAIDTRTGEQVVVKFPRPRTLDHPVLAGRWRREAAITESLAHPNLQCRHDVGERHHEPYIVIDYAGGGSLDGWISAGGPRLPVGQAVHWGRELAEALAYLHHLGIIHRDLKPGNILVTDDLQLKLADFGAATIAGPQRWWHLPAPPEGTPQYLSPEQITGHIGDQRSDIYGWGIVMYELLTGHVPYSGPSPLAAMTAHLNSVPVPIRNQRGDVPPALEAVILHALRRYPEHRYPTALALLHDLDRLDSLDPAGLDHSPEPPMGGAVGGAEGPAIARLVLAVASGFIAIAAAVILLSIALR